MRLLLINPNISASVSALIEAEAQRSASAGTQITVLTAPFGVAYGVAQLAAENYATHDAVIVAAFGDPGLSGLREVLPMPVLGLTESALASACLLGHRFSIIAISQRIQAWYREVVEANGLASISSVQEEHADALRVLCERAVTEDGAEVIVLAGARAARAAAGAGGRRRLQRRAACRIIGGAGSRQSVARQLCSAAAQIQPGTARRAGPPARDAPPQLPRNSAQPQAVNLSGKCTCCAKSRT